MMLLQTISQSNGVISEVPENITFFPIAQRIF
jgi:hypothetical protein